MDPADSLQTSKTIRITEVEELAIETKVVRKDRQGRIQYANDAFCRCFERSREELIGQTDFELLPDGPAQSLSSEIKM